MDNSLIYKQEISRLKRRISYRKQQGYKIDINKLLDNTTGGENIEQDIEYIRSLRGTSLLSYADYETEDIGDFGEYMNEPDFTSPDDRIDPQAYSYIEQIEQILLNMPQKAIIQFDEGRIGNEYDVGERAEISIEFIGDALYDVYLETRNTAQEQNRLVELDNYYASVQDELAKIINSYDLLDKYHFESDLISDFTQALRLLNWGEALSQAEMEKLDDLISSADVVLMYEDER